MILEHIKTLCLAFFNFIIIYILNIAHYYGRSFIFDNVLKKTSNWGYVLYKLNSKSEFYELMQEIPESKSFYPKTKLVDCNEKVIIPHSQLKRFVMKPNNSYAQNGVIIIDNDDNLTDNVKKHMDDYINYKVWLLQECIHSFLAKLPNDKIGRKTVLRSYIYVNCVSKKNKQIYMYDDIIATVFCKEYTGSTDTYENVNINSSYYKNEIGRPMNEEEREDNYKSLSTLVASHVFDSTKRRMTNITRLIFDKLIDKYVDYEKLDRMFAADWILDVNHNVYILEINSGPDFEAYRNVAPVYRLFNSVQNLKNIGKDEYFYDIYKKY